MVTEQKALDIEDLGGSSSGVGSSNVASTHVLVLAWATPPSCARVGEALTLGAIDEVKIFGRTTSEDEDEEDGDEHTLLRKTRPGAVVDSPGAPLDDPFLARHQLEIANHIDGVRVVNVGKSPMLVAGKIVTRAVVKPFETLEIKNRLLFVCVRRPLATPPLHSVPSPLGVFGEPDASGYVGESVAAWSLRDRVAFLAKRAGHMLVLGESGTGKELVAQAIHAQSERGRKRLVARNAATFPSGLIDAELFGNVANYPNAGMPERPGLIGEAEGSTVFLDEIGELSEALQAHLLRVLDEGGEYQRLGDARHRKADIRLVAASNRPLSQLKRDLAGRLRLRLELPGLNERVEDVPLVARHLLRKAATKDSEIGARFFEGWDGKSGEPRISLDLMKALVTHHYTTHVREVDMLLWSSLTTSPGNTADLTDEVRRSLTSSAAPPSASPRSSSPTHVPTSTVRTSDVTEEQVRASMAMHHGVKERVWRELGLPSRFALRRLLTKFGIAEDVDDEVSRAD